MVDLRSIQQQIETLQKQANAIKSKEFDNTVVDILATMHAFGITIKDLQTAGSRVRKSGRTKSAPRLAGTAKKQAGGPAKVAPKYRGPGGETWSGRGLSPRWLAALIAQGRSKEEFVIGG